MAAPMIETGYKPEFALGALYSGENAAYAEQSQQEDMVKQFLANQRERTSQPMDMDIKDLQAGQARIQNTPEMLQAFRDNAKAGYNKNIREDEIGGLLQPFKRQQAPLQGQRDVALAETDNQIAQVQGMINSGMNPDGSPMSAQDKAELMKNYNNLIALRGNTPEHWGKVDTENVKGDWDLRKQALVNSGHLATAEATAAKAKEDQLHKTYTAITSEVRTLTTEISRAESKDLENQIIADLLSKKVKQSDAEKEAKRQVTEYQKSLRAKKAELESYQRYILTQIPGLSTMQVAPSSAPAGSAQNPIPIK